MTFRRNPLFRPRTAAAFAASSLLILLLGVSMTASASTMPITTTCSRLTPSRTSVTSGSSGTILFNCGAKPAFTVISPGADIPIFSLPAGYTSLTAVPHVSGASTCSLGRQLVSGQETVFRKNGSFDYCTSYTSPPSTGLATFKLSWKKSG